MRSARDVSTSWAATSSRASGRPAQRRQSSSIRLRLVASSGKGRPRSATRVRNSAGAAMSPDSGSASRHRSSSMASGRRLVLSTVVSGHSGSSPLTKDETPSTNSSQPSSTTRLRPSGARYSASGPIWSLPPASTPRASATWAATSSSAGTPASPIHRSSSCPRKRAAASRASRVFPTPPRPTRVTAPGVLRAAVNSANSASRARKASFVEGNRAPAGAGSERKAARYTSTVSALGSTPS